MSMSAKKRRPDVDINKDDSEAFRGDNDDGGGGGKADRAVLQGRKIVRARRPIVDASNSGNTGATAAAAAAGKSIFSGVNLLASASSTTTTTAPFSFGMSTTTTSAVTPSAAAAPSFLFGKPAAAATVDSTSSSKNDNNTNSGTTTSSSGFRFAFGKTTKTGSSTPSSSLSFPPHRSTSAPPNSSHSFAFGATTSGSKNNPAIRTAAAANDGGVTSYGKDARTLQQRLEEMVSSPNRRKQLAFSESSFDETLKWFLRSAGRSQAKEWRNNKLNKPLTTQITTTTFSAPSTSTTTTATPASTATSSTKPAIQPFSFGSSQTASTSPAPFSFGAGSTVVPQAQPPSGNDDEGEEPAEDDEPSVLPTGESADKDWDNVAEYEKVIFFRKVEGKFAPFVSGALKLQRSKDDASNKRMVMRDDKGIKVLINIKIGGGGGGASKFTLSTQKNKKGVSYCQILFMGCNDAARGVEQWVIKANPEIGESLCNKLKELSS